MARSERVHWVDWLKILAVLGVFVYHSAMVYAYVNWVVSNADRSLVLTLFAGAGFSMGMPLLFLLSGAASFFALRKLGPPRFVDLRFRRLVIPFLAGLLVLSPLQAYLSLLNHGASHQGLWLYYPTFFSRMAVYFSPRWLANYGYHLWFLAFLFLYSVLALPFFTWLSGPGGGRFHDRLAGLSARTGGLLLFAPVPALVQVALRSYFPWYTDWADFAYWLTFFAIGYVLVTDRRFEVAVARRWHESLAVALGSTAILAAFAAVGLAGGFESRPVLTPAWAVYELTRTVNTWSVVVLVLALGIHAFNRAGRWVEHLDEAVLPFFVLHHPAVVLVAFFVVQMDAGLWTKFTIQLLVSFALIAAVYELGIRPFDSVRWLFALGPRRRGEPEPERPPATGPMGPTPAEAGRLASA